MRKISGGLCVVLSAAAVLVALGCAQTDAGITTKVKSKFAADDTVKAYQIDVDTKNKVVTLSGSVDSQAAKEQAVSLARGTQGVTDVVDNITVAGAAAPGTMGTEPGGTGMSTTPGSTMTTPGTMTTTPSAR